MFTVWWLHKISWKPFFCKYLHADLSRKFAWMILNLNSPQWVRNSIKFPLKSPTMATWNVALPKRRHALAHFCHIWAKRRKKGDCFWMMIFFVGGDACVFKKSWSLGFCFGLWNFLTTYVYLCVPRIFQQRFFAFFYFSFGIKLSSFRRKSLSYWDLLSFGPLEVWDKLAPKKPPPDLDCIC